MDFFLDIVDELYAAFDELLWGSRKYLYLFLFSFLVGALVTIARWIYIRNGAPSLSQALRVQQPIIAAQPAGIGAQSAEVPQARRNVVAQMRKQFPLRAVKKSDIKEEIRNELLREMANNEAKLREDLWNAIRSDIRKEIYEDNTKLLKEAIKQRIKDEMSQEKKEELQKIILHNVQEELKNHKNTLGLPLIPEKLRKEEMIKNNKATLLNVPQKKLRKESIISTTTTTSASTEDETEESEAITSITMSETVDEPESSISYATVKQKRNLTGKSINGRPVGGPSNDILDVPLHPDPSSSGVTFPSRRSIKHGFDIWTDKHDIQRAYIAKMKDEAEGFYSEFEALQNQTDKLKVKATAYKHKHNSRKNRYNNIYPYDDARVKLSGSETHDYINASFIEGYQKKKKYIATQGPKLNTIKDFWRMVWEYNVLVIVMLCKTVENGRDKCACYWAKNNYDQFHVNETSLKQMGGIVRHEISVSKSSFGPKRTVHMFQYIDWPDHGTPKNTTTVMYLRRMVNSFVKQKQSTAPIVVHCSAGAGRSGTFIVMDILFEQLANENKVNVSKTVLELRKCRTEMIQSQAQYQMLYQLLMDKYLYPETDISEKRFVDLMHSKIWEDVAQKEYKLFANVDALLNALETKGKKDKKKYNLMSKFGEDHIFSFKNIQDSFLPVPITICPLPNSSSEKTQFWKTIMSSSFTCLVTLDQHTHDSELIPSDEKKYRFPPFSLNVTDTVKKPEYIERTLKVSDEKEKSLGTMTLVHLNVTCWKNKHDILPKKQLFEIIHRTSTVGGKSDDKRCLVCCKDGQYKSGLFVTAASLLQRLSVQHRVDIFRSVKNMREDKIAVVDGVKGYKDLYKYIKKEIDESGAPAPKPSLQISDYDSN